MAIKSRMSNGYQTYTLARHSIFKNKATCIFRLSFAFEVGDEIDERRQSVEFLPPGKTRYFDSEHPLIFELSGLLSSKPKVQQFLGKNKSGPLISLKVLNDDVYNLTLLLRTGSVRSNGGAEIIVLHKKRGLASMATLSDDFDWIFGLIAVGECAYHR